jgi:hypothetical protein
MQLIEKFDQNKLAYLLDNRDGFTLGTSQDSRARIEYLKNTFGSNYDPWLMSEKYLKNSKDGIIKVSYKQTENKGRYHAIRGISLQSMPVEIRHTITQGLYRDIDVKNAHPTILSWLCDKAGISCNKLKYYNNNRDKCLADMVGVDRDYAKQVVLSLLNGGTKLYTDLPQRPEWLIEFKGEIQMIHKKLCEINKKEFNKCTKLREKNNIDFNHEGSFVNILMCRVENEILMTIYDKLGKPTSCCLCFDGIMIETECKFDMKELEKSVFDSLNIQIELLEKPMDLGFVVPDVIPEHVSTAVSNTFDYDINYFFNHFYNEFTGAKFDNDEDMDDALEVKSSLVIKKVLTGMGSFAKKMPDSVEVVGELKGCDFIMKCGGKEIKLSKYLNSKKDTFESYECKLFNSNPEKLNIWPGFQAKETQETYNVEVIKKLILETWASDNEEYYKYITSWLKGLVIDGMNKVALCLVSGQGTGKGFICDFLRLIIKSANVAECTGIEQIVKDKNTYLQNKRLVIINEMSSTREEFKSNFDKIKVYITESIIMMRPKYASDYDIDNIGNYILCSNHRDGFIVEGDDRRYAMFEVGAKYQGNDAYFKEIKKLVMNQDTANAFYTYLLNYEAVDITKIPNTQIRQEAINISKPCAVRYIDYIKEYPLEEQNTLTGVFEEMKEIKASELYSKFTCWCRDNGERNVPSNTKFGTAILDKIQKKRTNKGYVYILS